jgi:hypothetical protein
MKLPGQEGAHGVDVELKPGEALREIVCALFDADDAQFHLRRPPVESLETLQDLCAELLQSQHGGHADSNADAVAKCPNAGPSRVSDPTNDQNLRDPGSR